MVLLYSRAEILESDKPEITVTSSLATCLIFLCLGFLFYGDNNSI